MNPAVGENAPKWLCIESRNFSTSTPHEYPVDWKERKARQLKRMTFAHGPVGTISLVEASKRYGVPYKTIIKYVKSGKINAVIVHSDFFITANDLLDFMKHDWKPKPRKAS